MLAFNVAPDELQLFLQEAEEQLQLLDQDIVLLEKEGARPELLQEIFRAAHTLKGSSGAIAHRKMASLTHAMESVLDHLRRGGVECSTGLIDALLQSLDGLRLLREEVVTLQDCGFDPAELVQRLDALVAGFRPAGGDPSRSAPAAVVAPEAPPEGACDLRVVVRIAEDSSLPAARSLQVYLEASRFGQVVACSPSLEAIESEQVDHRLELVVRARVETEDLVEALRAIPDVVEVAAQPVPGPGATGSREDGEAGALGDAETGRPGDGETGRRGDGETALSTQHSGPRTQDSAPGNGAAPARSNGLGKTVRIDVARLDDLMNLVGELVIERTRLTQLGGALQSRYEDESVRDLAETSQHIGRIVDELQEGIMKARMLPVESLFNRLPRVVRDLARRAGKKIDFVMEGEETELDRSVIEELHDPLVHLLRNAVDHGIEPPAERLAAGKPEVGRIKLSAVHRENRILLLVEDDGAGIDPARIREVAVRRGAISVDAAERLSDQETVELIFAPGFSTAETVSDVSGRGVGMDIVRTNIEKLNGAVVIESRPGEGARFTLELPLTLAIIDALMVGVDDQILAIPLVSVVETLRVVRSEIHRVNRHQVVQLRGNVLPLIQLDQALGMASRGSRVRWRGDAETRRGRASISGERVFVVAVRVGEQRIGLLVDSLVGELQVVVKSLGRRVGNISGITGATILGDGRVALILDVPSLVKCVLDEQARG